LTAIQGRTFTYNAGRPHLPSADSAGWSYSYDDNGNMTGRVSSVGGVSATDYQYDAENRLVRANQNGQVTTFLYDGQGQLVRRADPGDATTFYAGDHYQVQFAWSEAEDIFPVNTEGGEVATDQRHPDLIEDEAGRLHLAWADDDESGTSGRVRYARYEPGTGWTTPEDVVDDLDNNSEVLWPAITLVSTSTDEIYVAWILRDSGTSYELHVQQGPDWSETLVVTGSIENQNDPLKPALTPAPGNNGVYLAWADTISRTTIQMRSDVSGSWQPVDLSGVWSDGDQHQPVLATDSSGTIYLAYVEEVEFDRSIYLLSGTAGNWGTPEAVSGGIGSPTCPPGLVTDNLDNLYVGWGGTVRQRTATGSWQPEQMVDEFDPHECGIDLVVDRSNTLQWVAIRNLSEGSVTVTSLGGSFDAGGPKLAVGPPVAPYYDSFILVWSEGVNINGDLRSRLRQAIYRPRITKRYEADGRQLALDLDGALYYTLLEPSGTSLTLVDTDGVEAGHIVYDAFGGVLSSYFYYELEAALGSVGALPDPATGLVHLGNGRWYDPVLGRPLQPNPVGGPPTAPQALNRYAATSLGQPGVAQGITAGDLDLASPTAWLGLTANIGLEVAGRNVVRQSGRLVLEGSASALERTLAGKGLPFAIQKQFTVGGPLGDLAIGLSGRLNRRLQQRLIDELVSYSAVTAGKVGLIDDLGAGLFRFRGFGRTIDTTGLAVRYQRGLLLGEAKALSFALSLGATFLIDAGFETYESATGTGQFGNPFLTTRQKRAQVFVVVGGNLLFTGGLLLATTNPYIVIPAAFVWAISAEPLIYENLFPGFYEENRNLKPLQVN
jgi:YD repeat-containing protein